MTTGQSDEVDDIWRPVASSSLPAEGTYSAGVPALAGPPSEQEVVEPQGCGCSNGTIWFDPLPDDCRHPTEETLPTPGNCPNCRPLRSAQGQETIGDNGTVPADNRSFLDRLQGHGPFGLAKDPLAAPEAEVIPEECDEIDVGPDTPWAVSMTRWWTRDLELLGGVHGFKGPFDQGLSGNFGFHGGFNFGAPLGICDWGWQIGAEVAESNLTGSDTINESSDNRTQFFVTGGIFRRARDWGFQWGVVYDWLHDAYYANADLKQIRSDTSFIFPGRVHEIGYFGAYGTGNGNWVLIDRPVKNYFYLEPTDVFAFYYRRYFDGGGDGRIWLGWSGDGDGVLGGEIRVPMGKSWELQNRFNYLIPRQGNGAGATNNESWAVTIDLVFYIGHPARCERWHPYRPMLNVADNTLFMTKTFVPAQ